MADAMISKIGRGIAAEAPAQEFELHLQLTGQDHYFGPGPRRLLELIDTTGSVRRACGEMGMSYSKAWRLINTLERQLGGPAVERRQGGSHGGGARLTSLGRELLERYNRFYREVLDEAQLLYQQHFGRWLPVKCRQPTAQEEHL